MIDYAPNLDVHIIPDTVSDAAVYQLRGGRKKNHIVFSVTDTLKSTAILILSSLVGMIFQKFGFDEANIITVFVLGVLVTAVITKHQIYSLIFSIVSVLVFNFLFTEPQFTLQAYDQGYPVTFIIMFLAAFLTGSLAIRIKNQAKQAAQSAYRTKVLFDKRAESREKMLDRITPLDKPVDSTKEMHFTLEPSQISGNDVLTVEHLSKQFDSQVLFSDISFEIKRGEHVAVIGDNGTGKTTLLKIINQVIAADQGEFTLGSKVTIGYYDQEHHVLHDDKTIFDEISDDYPDLTNTQIRNTLAAFQFTGDEVFKEIHTLSGGEKGRVSLAKLMLSEANFLILDEPTNHLDITSKEILEEALNNYSGTILYVSHDRYFINQTASRILELVNQTFVNYIGNYDYYLEKKEALTLAYASGNETNAENVSNSGNSAASTPASDSKLSWQEQKEQQARERKRKNELKKTEEEIAKLRRSQHRD